MQERPTGISIIVVTYFVIGILSVLWSGMILGIGGLSAFFGSIFGADSMATFGASSAWTGYLGILVAVVQIITAWGLTTMKKWGWVLALIGIALTVIQGLVNTFTGGVFGFICGSLGLIIPLIILFYLLRADIRIAFGIGDN